MVANQLRTKAQLSGLGRLVLSESSDTVGYRRVNSKREQGRTPQK